MEVDKPILKGCTICLKLKKKVRLGVPTSDDPTLGKKKMPRHIRLGLQPRTKRNLKKKLFTELPTPGEKMHTPKNMLVWGW